MMADLGKQMLKTTLLIWLLVEVEFNLLFEVCTLDLAKWDLWGLGAESCFVVASYAFAKMIFQLDHDSAPRLQRFRFANPNVHTIL